MRAARMEANIRRREGYFVRGSDLAYSLETLRGGDYEVYGRVCNLHVGAGKIEWRHGGGKPFAAIPPDPVWRHVRLGSLRIEESGAGGELVITGMSGEAYFDQLYLVRREHQAAFEALPADWRGGAAL